MMNYEDTKEKIGLLIKQKNYKDAEEKTYNFINYLLKVPCITDREKYYLWSCYIKLAICNRREDRYMEAIDLATKALSYCITESDEHECYWIMGICYKYLGDFQKALLYYNKCISYYANKGNLEYLVKVLKCKALMLHSEELLRETINIYTNSTNINIEILNDLKETLNELVIFNKADKDTEINKVISLDTYKALCNKTAK